MRVPLFLILTTWLAVGAPSAKGRAKAAAPEQSPGQSPTQGEADLAEAGRQHALAVQLFSEKKYDEAIVAAKRAAEIREKSLGAENYFTRTSLNNLAQLYIAKGDYDNALKILQRLLPIYEKVLKPGSEETFKALELIAALSSRERKPGDAEKAYKRNLELREAAGGESPQTARALYLLASFYQFNGKPDQAKPLYQRAVSIWEKDASSSTPEYAAAVERYSCLLRKDNREAEADELSSRAAESMGRANGKAATDANGSGMEIQGGVLNGRAIVKNPPRYPPAARDAREQGVVVVRVTVDETGRVILACAVSGPRGLRDASEGAAYGWRFTPTLLSGMPVKVNGTITFNFQLQ
jgi:TonB family protein